MLTDTDKELIKEFTDAVNYMKERDKKEAKIKTPVRASHIMKITGLDREGMRKARMQGLLKRIAKDGGYWYILEHTPKHLLIK